MLPARRLRCAAVARKIVSIASAPGWKARILDEDELDGYRVVTLVSWALVEDATGATEIVGIVQRGGGGAAGSRLGFADEVEGFDGYAFTGVATRSHD
jgi:hypothetical protein